MSSTVQYFVYYSGSVGLRARHSAWYEGGMSLISRPTRKDDNVFLLQSWHVWDRSKLFRSLFTDMKKDISLDEYETNALDTSIVWRQEVAGLMEGSTSRTSPHFSFYRRWQPQEQWYKETSGTFDRMASWMSFTIHQANQGSLVHPVGYCRTFEY